MIIQMDISAINDNAAERWLNLILHKVEDGWHVWDTSNFSNLPANPESPWLCNRRVQELFKYATKRMAWPGGLRGRRIRVTATPRLKEELVPEDAGRLAEQPLTILVENRYSDGSFVKRVVIELDKALYGIWKSPGCPIRLDSVGGVGQMGRAVRQRIKRSPATRPRLVLILDSDRKYPGESLSASVRKLCRLCKQYNIPIWLLEKREAENYIPRILLQELLASRGATHSDRDRLEAWDRLTEKQKDFIDVKCGMPANPNAGEQTLFSSVSIRDRQALSSGFGGKVHEAWCCWAVQPQSEISKRGGADLLSGLQMIWAEV